jgi:hypothetical protein
MPLSNPDYTTTKTKKPPRPLKDLPPAHPQLFHVEKEQVSPQAKPPPSMLDRHAVAAAVTQRVSAFTPQFAGDHPITTAQLVRSSIPTDQLFHIARHIQTAWNHVQQAAYDEQQTKLNQLGRADDTYQVQPISLDDVPDPVITALQHYQQKQPLTDQDRQALIAYSGTDNASFVLAAIAGAPLETADIPLVTGIFASPGSVLGGVGLGVLFAGEPVGEKFHIAPLAAAGHISNAVLSGGIRALEEIAAVPIGLLGEAQGKDVHWRDMLSFWDSSKHEPLTIAAYGASGQNINDPNEQKKVELLDGISQLVGFIAVGRFTARAGELIKLPAESGGYFSADSAAGRYFTRPFFNKAAEIIDASPDHATAVGNLQVETDFADPFLSSYLVDAYKAGGIEGMRKSLQTWVSGEKVASELVDLRAKQADLSRKVAEAPEEPPPKIPAAPVTMTSKADIGKIGYDGVDAFYTISSAENGPSIASGGLDPAYAQHGNQGIHFSSDPFATYDLSDAATAQGAGGAFNIYRVRPESADFIQFGDTMKDSFVRERIPPEVIEVWTDEGWRPLVEEPNVGPKAAPESDIYSTQLDVVRRQIEALSNRRPQIKWPRVASVRGVLKGGPATSWTSKILKGIYENRLENIGDLTHLTDNLRDGRTWWNPRDRSKPADFAETTLDDVRKKMSAAGVDNQTIIRRLGEYTEIRSEGDYFDWRDRISTDLENVLHDKIPPEELYDITHNLRNPEAGRSRAEYETTIVKNGRPVKIQTKVLETTEGQPRPFVEPEFASSARGPEIARLREANSFWRNVAQKSGLRVPYDWVRNINRMATNVARIGILAFKPKILFSIHASQMLMMQILGAVEPGAGFIPRIFERLRREGAMALPGGVIVDFDAAYTLAEKYFPSLSRTREAAEAFHGVDPRDIGQSYMNVAGVEPTTSVPVPTGAFRAKFLEGKTTPEENYAWAKDQHAEFQKYNNSPMTQSLIMDGVDATVEKMVSGTGDLRDFYETTEKPNLYESYGRPTGPAELKETLLNLNNLINEISGGDPSVRQFIATGKWTGTPINKALRAEVLQEEARALSGTQTGNYYMDLAVNAKIIDLETKAAAITDRPTMHIEMDDQQAVTNELLNRAATGKYQIPSRVYREVPRSAVEGLEIAQLAEGNIIDKIQSIAYRAMRWWSPAELALTKGTFWESSWLKWRDRFLRTGVDVKTAEAEAQARAHFETRDWLHDTGNRSSLQASLKNDIPFMHAWQKVLWTWFYKVPTYIGGDLGPASTLLGASLLKHEYDALRDILKASGALRTYKDAEGKEHETLVIPNPLQLLSWFPGIKVSDELNIADPWHLLIPIRVIHGEVPTVSPQLSYLIDFAADRNAPILKSINRIITKDGAFSPTVPGTDVLTSVWEATTGTTPPWAIGRSKKYQQYVIDRTKDQALRYAFSELAQGGYLPPNPADFSTPQEYNQARDDYWARADALSKQYYHGLMLMHNISLTSSIMSFTPTTEEEQAYRAFLDQNSIKLGEPRTPEQNALIDKYLGDHPESLAYATSMYRTNAKWPKDKSYEAFKNGIASGDIQIKSPDQYRAALATAQEWGYFNEASRSALEQAGLGSWNSMSPQQQLRNWGARNAALDPVWDNFNDFLDGDPEAKKLWEANASEYSKLQNKIHDIEASRALLGDKVADAKIDALYAQLQKTTGYGKTKEEHLTWYRAVPFSEYMDKVTAVYDKIDAIYASRAPNTSELVAGQYDKLRELNASYAKGVTAPDGSRYPSPEEFAFTRKSPDDQLGSRTKWAELPPSYLSEYQLNVVYGIKPTPKTSKYLAQESKVQNYFDAKTKGLSHSSNEYADWVAWRDKALGALAGNIGGTAERIRKLESDIPAGRLEEAGILPDNKTMDWIVANARNIAARVHAEGYSVAGTSKFAEYYRGYIEGYIDQIRNPDSDIYNREVDIFFRKQTKATGITDQHALYREVLWGTPSGFFLPYDFSYEEKVAGAVGKVG